MNLWRGIRITDETIYKLKIDLPNTWGPKVFEFLLNTKALMIQLNLSLRIPLKYQHLTSKYGGQFFRSWSNSDILFSQWGVFLIWALSNKDNAHWISDNYGLLMLREKKHEYYFLNFSSRMKKFYKFKHFYHYI